MTSAVGYDVGMDLSQQQTGAVSAIRDWYMSRNQPGHNQVFRLFGYAGTGKTTLAKTIGAGKQTTMFAAYTGKAAQVLTSKGCPATTLHKLIYKPNGERVEYERDEDGFIKLDDAGKPIKVKGSKPKPNFVLDPESPLFYADLLVVDEVSMVDNRLGEDLLSFGVPTLVLGDPAQLPPVEGGGYFTKQHPDVLLDEVHRQAEGSEVLRMATEIRQGGRPTKIPGCDYNTAIEFDQVIVGTNAMRWDTNQAMREAMGRPYGEPTAGDKIIVLQNNYDLNVMNGESYTCLEYDPLTGIMKALDEFGTERLMRVWQQGFTKAGEAELKSMPYRDQTQRVMATFAWAITCHKSQGSQWNTVLVVDESHVFRRDRQRWLYTAVTRAAEEVHVVNPGGMYERQKKTFAPRQSPRRK